MSGAERLRVERLSVCYETARGTVQAVREVSFSLRAGEVLAVVGESGCGKSTLCRSLLCLLPERARVTGGSICLNGMELTACRERQLRALRGREIGMVFQDPARALCPALPVGRQLAEAVTAHERLRPADVRARVSELLALVGLEEAAAARYAGQLSGGQRQRAVLAAALAGRPGVLVADEPTTALDVTIQAQILSLFRQLQRTLDMASVLVTHDLGVAAHAADRVAVMYAGRIVECGTPEELFGDPRHPYTWGLLRAHPAWADRREPLYVIPGMPPSGIGLPPGDAFAPRNDAALAIDYEQAPPAFWVSETHWAATWLLDARAPRVVPPWKAGAGHG